MAFLFDGQSALSGSTDGIMRLWEIETGAEQRQFGATLAVCWQCASHRTAKPRPHVLVLEEIESEIQRE